MADLEFEARLGRMFDEPPALSGGEAFAHGVETRLNRGWGVRQLLIGAAGLAGGVIGAGQLFGSGVMPRFQAVSEQAGQAFTHRLDGLLSGESLAALPLSGEVMWMAAALGVMALAFALTRAIEEF
jgi:hypothetical protein